MMDRRMIGTLGLVCVMLMGVGCNQRLSQERNSLWQQNEELQLELERCRAALDAERNDVAGLQSRIDELQRRLNATPAPTADPFGDLGSGISTRVTDNAVTVSIPGDVLFDSGRAELKPAVRTALNRIASVIQTQYPNNLVRVEGYTDTDPIQRSSWDDNLELSLQRAAAVHRHLASQGISTDRMYAAGFGETRPMATKEASRRVEIVVLLAE